MRRFTSYLLTFLLLVLIVEIVLLSPTDVLEDQVGQQALLDFESNPQAGDDVEQMMDTVHVIETRDQKKEWEMWADKATGYRDSARLALDSVRVDFFALNGITFNVVGRSGSVFPNAKDMSVEGDVVTTSSNGYTFRTDSMNYNSDLRQLTSPGQVEVLGPKENNSRPLYIKGQKMKANMIEGVMLIHDSVRAQKTINKNRLMVVEAQSAKLSGHDKSVKFSGNVTIDLDGIRITGPDALLNFDSTEDLLRSIELEGGVKVSDINKSATSNKLKINLLDNKYIFDGNPRIIQDEDEVSGDRIIFLDGGKKVQIENARVRVRGQSLEKTKENRKVEPKNKKKVKI